MGDSVSNIADFEAFNFKDMLKGVSKDPWKLLVGAGTPIGSELWDGILGKDTEPFVNLYGGPTEGAFTRAEEAGIDTSDSRGSHKIAEAVASTYAGAGLGNVIGAQTGLSPGISNQIASSGQSAVGGALTDGGGGSAGGQAKGGAGGLTAPPAGAQTGAGGTNDEKVQAQHAQALMEQLMRTVAAQSANEQGQPRGRGF